MFLKNTASGTFSLLQEEVNKQLNHLQDVTRRNPRQPSARGQQGERAGERP